MKKILVLSIIFLFIGVAVAPSINFTVVKASDDDLVEVTTQACGIQGFGNTTVKLTREQYQNLEQYLVDFRARLNQTTTREEAVPLFKEAVVELNKYGLLPKGMSISVAERLVNGFNLFDKYVGFFKRVTNLIDWTIENQKCFIFAQGLSGDFSLLTQLLMLYVEPNPYPGPIVILYVFMVVLSSLNPIHMLYLMDFFPGCTIYSISFLPLKNYIGYDRHVLIGFTGLKLFVSMEKCYYFGRTLLVLKPNY